MSHMSYISERRQEEKDRRRAEIVDAAEALYAEMGWDAITMDQVARRARLSRALLYVYFRDKADLHLALVERSLDALRERSSRPGRASRAASPRSRPSAAPTWPSRATSRITSTRARATRRTRRAATRRTRTKRPAWPPAIAATKSSSIRSNRGVADGSVRGDLGDPYVTALSLWAFSHGLIQIASTKRGQIEHEGTPVQAFIDHALGLALGRCGHDAPVSSAQASCWRRCWPAARRLHRARGDAASSACAGIRRGSHRADGGRAAARRRRSTAGQPAIACLGRDGAAEARGTRPGACPLPPRHRLRRALHRRGRGTDDRFPGRRPAEPGV